MENWLCGGPQDSFTSCLFGALAIIRFYKRRFTVEEDGGMVLLFAIPWLQQGYDLGFIPLFAAFCAVHKSCVDIEEAVKHCAAFAALYIASSSYGVTSAPLLLLFTAFPQLARRPAKLKERLTLFRVACGPAFVITATSYGYNNWQSGMGYQKIFGFLCCSLALLAGTFFRPDNIVLLRVALGRGQLFTASTRKRVHALCMTGSLVLGLIIWACGFLHAAKMGDSLPSYVNPPRIVSPVMQTLKGVWFCSVDGWV